jgi:phosphotransferase system enzyme I (PtsP)
MFPLVAQMGEFSAARGLLLKEIEREGRLGHVLPETLEIGAMLETPSMAFAPEAFFRGCDFISVGGNDLKQFFFAADRENELVRRRYDTLDVSYLGLLRQVVARCDAAGTPLSFCGEDAGRPVEAVTMAALGFRALSMRPASIGPVKSLIRRVDLGELRARMEAAEAAGAETLRPAVLSYLTRLG